MNTFFADMCDVIPVKGSLRMVINRDSNDHMIVTVEIKTENGWTSPTVGTGHPTSLDSGFFKELAKGVAQISALKVDTSKMVASAAPAAANTEKTTAAKPTAAKPTAKVTIAPAPAPAEPVAQDMFSQAAEEAEVIEDSGELELDPITKSEVELNDESGLGEASGLLNENDATAADIGIAEMAMDEHFESDINTGATKDEIPDREAGMEKAKSYFQDKDYQKSVDTLKNLQLFYPADEEIKTKIAKISLKLVPVAENDF